MNADEKPLKRRYYTADTLERATQSYERLYGMSSEAFYEAYRDGENMMVPGFERHVWASLVEDIRRMRAAE